MTASDPLWHRKTSKPKLEDRPLPDPSYKQQGELQASARELVAKIMYGSEKAVYTDVPTAFRDSADRSVEMLLALISADRKAATLEALERALTVVEEKNDVQILEWFDAELAALREQLAKLTHTGDGGGA